MTRAERKRSQSDTLRPRTIGANAGFALVGQVGNSLFAAFLTVFLVRVLSVHTYGVLGLATAITGLILLPADFGLTMSTSRYVAEQGSDGESISTVIAAGLRLKLFTTGSVCLLAFLCAGVVASAWGKPDLAWPLRAMAVTSLIQSIFTLLSAVMNGMGRNDLVLRVAIGESIFETSAVVALVLAGGGATGAAFGRTIGFSIGAAIGLITIVRLLGRAAVDVRRPPEGWGRRLLTYGAAIVVLDSTYALFSQVDVVLIGAIISTTAVSLYSAPFRFISLLFLPASALSAGVAPRLVSGGSADMQRRFIEATRLIAVFQGLLVAPLLMWPAPIVSIALGSSYGGAVSVLRVFTLYVFLSGFGLFFSLSANFLGQVRRRIGIAVGTVAINVIIDLVLLPRIGVVGGAVGTGIAYSFYVPGHAVICQRQLGISIRSLIAPVVRVVPAAAVMCGVLVAFGTHPSHVAIVLGACLGIALYLLVTLITGALRRDDVDRATHMVARLVR